MMVKAFLHSHLDTCFGIGNMSSIFVHFVDVISQMLKNLKYFSIIFGF